MTTPAATSAAPGAGLDPVTVRKAIIAAMPENIPLRGRMARSIMAAVVQPILDDLAASRSAEAAAIRERDELAKAFAGSYERCARLSSRAVDLQFVETNLLDLARMYGEACGRLAEYRHAAVEWQQEQVEYKAFYEAALAAANAQAERLAAALRPFAKAGELFGPRAPDDFDQCVYMPAAGPEYALSGDHLRAARAALEPAAEVQETGTREVEDVHA